MKEKLIVLVWKYAWTIKSFLNKKIFPSTYKLFKKKADQFWNMSYKNINIKHQVFFKSMIITKILAKTEENFLDFVKMYRSLDK